MTHHHKIIPLFLVILLLIAGSVHAAAEKIGFVAALRGKVVAVNPDKGKRYLNIKDEIFIKDTIKTGKRSRIQLVFADNTIISLGRVSVLNMAEYEWNSQQNKGKITSNISEGIFRIMGGAIAKTSPEKFKTVTPSATIGIRGSMYAGQVRGGRLSVVFLGGRGIEVQNPAGTVVISEPGFGTRVNDPGSPPEEPSEISVTEMMQSDQDSGDAPEDDTGVEDDNGGNDDSAGNDTGTDDNTADNNDSLAGDSEGEVAADTPLDSGSDSGGDITADTTSTDISSDVQGVTTQAVADSSQDTTQGTFTENITTTSSPTMTGSYLSILLDSKDSSNSRIWQGNTSGYSSYDLSLDEANVTGHTSASGRGIKGAIGDRNFSWTNPASPYNPSLSFNGDIELHNQFRIIEDLVISGQAETFDTLEVHYGLPGEFNGTILLAKSFDGQHSFFEIKSIGIPAPATVPYEIMGYSGGGLGGYIDYDRSTTEIDAFLVPDYYLEVNSHNRNVVGYFFNDSQEPDLTEEIIKVYFIGYINGSEINITKFFGHGGSPKGVGSDDRIIAWDGSAGGQFYGSEYQGIALSGSGHFYDMATSREIADIFLGIGGMKAYEDVLTPDSAPQGSRQFTGFVTGISEDMANPDVNRRLFFSKNPDDLYFTVNQDTGAITGSLRSAEDLDSNNTLANIQIGGSFSSAYTLSDWFVAGLGCTTGDCVTGTNGLKSYGNYLATAELTDENEISDYVSWGYWEISYDDPASGKPYHLHVPGSLWVAGEQTPASEIQNLRDTNFTATYTGQARGVHINGTQVNELPNGTTDLTIAFGQSQSNPVSGSINFPNVVNLTVDSSKSSLTSSGFNASFQSSDSSGMNGAFYGPNGAAVGGNFNAVQGSDRYMGIFLGDR